MVFFRPCLKHFGRELKRTPAGGTEDSCDSGTFFLDFMLLAWFSAVFIVCYSTHMYVVEVYLATQETHFAFMAFKHCFGCLHLVLLPIAILILKRDIRKAAADVYLRKSATQANSAELTLEQVQTHLGIGVQPS